MMDGMMILKRLFVCLVDEFKFHGLLIIGRGVDAIEFNQ